MTFFCYCGFCKLILGGVCFVIDVVQDDGLGRGRGSWLGGEEHWEGILISDVQ